MLTEARPKGTIVKKNLVVLVTLAALAASLYAGPKNGNPKIADDLDLNSSSVQDVIVTYKTPPGLLDNLHLLPLVTDILNLLPNMQHVKVAGNLLPSVAN